MTSRTTIRKVRRGAITVVERNVDTRDLDLRTLPRAQAKALVEEIRSMASGPHSLEQDVEWRLRDAQTVLAAHGLPDTVPDVGHIQQKQYGWVVHYAIKVAWAAHNVARFRGNQEIQARCAIDLGEAYALMVATLEHDAGTKTARDEKRARVEQRQEALRALAVELFSWTSSQPLTVEQRRRLREAFRKTHPTLAERWGEDTQRKDERVIGLRS